MSRLLQCYICGAEGSTREHVPPLAFFPRGFRKDLWTVRSCEQHNIGNSKDVEYVRNVIVSHRNCTGTAQELAHSAAFRSYERSAALYFQTFQGARPTAVDGETTPLPLFDLGRFDRVMRAIASGLYSREVGEMSRCEWHVFSPTLFSTGDLRSTPPEWHKVGELISAVQFVLKSTPEPTVFKYWRRMFNGRVDTTYAFEFYGGFHVYTWNH
jgi:hypothetical protein